MQEYEQLPLFPAPSRSDGRTEFIQGESNILAYQGVERWPNWSKGAFLVYGPEDSGKSHLAAIWAQKAKPVLARKYLRCAPESAVLFSLRGNWLVEDFERILPADPHRQSKRAPAEECYDRICDVQTRLIALLKAAENHEASILMTARRHPNRIPNLLPDVLSRLLALDRAAIREPEQELLQALCAKILWTQHIAVEPDAVAYLVSKLPRTHTAVLQAASVLVRISTRKRQKLHLSAMRRLWKVVASRLSVAVGAEKRPSALPGEHGPQRTKTEASHC